MAVATWLQHYQNMSSSVVVFLTRYLGTHLFSFFNMVRATYEGLSVVTDQDLLLALASESGNHYPRQLQQAVTLLEYLIYSEATPPSAITLLGDSAGGHLALSLLLHLAHPNPLVSPLPMEGRLSGAALISPWVINMDPGYESLKANEDKDLLSAAALNYWTKNFMGSSTPDYWNSVLTVPAEWWADLPVEDILVTYGNNEVLRDGALDLSKAMQAGHPRTTARKYSNELHAHMVMNRFLHFNRPCESEKVFRSWIEGGDARNLNECTQLGE